MAKSYSPRVPALAHTTRHNMATLSTQKNHLKSGPLGVCGPPAARAARPLSPMIGWAASRGILRPRSAALPSDTARLPRRRRT